MGIVNRFSKSSWATRTSALFVMCATAVITLPAQTFTTLHNFVGTDGANPYAGVIQGSNGDGYGTTENGGTNNSGTVFKITPGGTLLTLYNFCAQTSCTDGAYPLAGLVQTSNGYFYGTTAEGGANGLGTVFRVTANALTTLHSFAGTDGQTPWAGLVTGSNGDLYGTTVNGGANNGGTVFKITPGGALTTLYTFCQLASCTDGQHPEAGLLLAADGEFYGTTVSGGAYNEGTIFAITPGGALTTVYSFCAQSGCPDGKTPSAALIQGTNGDFYGTTASGGAHGSGTIFNITAAGALTTMHSFCAQTGCADGSFPDAALIQATDGNFYGTTSAGGANGAGIIYEITSTNTFTRLHSFAGPNAIHQGGLFEATNGDFYGASWDGGTDNDGTVYNLSVGLVPFVKLQPPSGTVGAAVTILGSNLTGTTSVSFNGTSAAFVVVSGSEITTTVPSGASSGSVKVVTPNGTFYSNVTFRVVP
jgi:uncharacterized repeat protein (TIGR03803 family)